MDEKPKVKLTVTTKVKASKEKVWECWTEPVHIKKWNQASDDWHTPSAENDLSVGGRFLYRMEAKDGSGGFDFTGYYDEIEPYKRIAYTLDDSRPVEVIFKELQDAIEIIETFEAEDTFALDYQQQGWQAILEQFKKYTETIF